MASPCPQPPSITATEQRPSPQFHRSVSVTAGLSPPKPLAVAPAGFSQLVDDSDLLDLSHHFSTQRAPRRRRGQVSESEVETYQRWRLDISKHI